jgi:hypothetical protein
LEALEETAPDTAEDAVFSAELAPDSEEETDRPKEEAIAEAAEEALLNADFRRDEIAELELETSLESCASESGMASQPP